ncbi:MAG: nuclear transport factor 2 family protein, partial [Candidatus Micropelagos thuwalensis]|nr:nuclear transport factor 2 family protein [Candidatus Micropelagos thuwalensis]
DIYEKRKGVWKFSSRSIDADWVYVSDPSDVALDHPMIDGVHIGCPGTSDPSYKLLKLFKPGPR